MLHLDEISFINFLAVSHLKPSARVKKKGKLVDRATTLAGRLVTISLAIGRSEIEDVGLTK